MSKTHSLSCAIIAGISGLLASSAIASNLDITNECHNNFTDNLEDCDENYGPGDTQNPNPNADPLLLQGCTDGAQNGLDACLDGAGIPGLETEWRDYLANLAACESHSSPILKQACINGALTVYKSRLKDLPRVIGNNCNNTPLPLNSSEIESLKSTSTPSGFAPITANTTTSFTSGISVNPGGTYDTGLEPCLKDAIAIAIHTTTNGNVAKAFSADTNLTNGTLLNYSPVTSDLIHTKSVTIVVTYYDHDSIPVFVEYADMEIEDSPIAGDWNRDLVANYFDVYDYLATYAAGLPRADLNQDGNINFFDVDLFMAEYSGS